MVIRSWRFVANGKGVDLARIYGIKGRLEKVSTLLSGVEVNETGKMVLRNVNGSYHGAYSFQVAILGSSSSSIVHVYVAGRLPIIELSFSVAVICATTSFRTVKISCVSCMKIVLDVACTHVKISHLVNNLCSRQACQQVVAMLLFCQVVPSLLYSQLVDKLWICSPITSCWSLLTTSLLQAVNRLDASCRVIHRLVTSCFNKSQQA